MLEKIGKYRIVEQIGRGGMGLIFKARDPVLDRLVALKVISTDVEITDELRARFFREAQACAQLSHPNIVTVYAMGDEGGQLFIVMELLEGEELKRLIAERRALALEDKLSIMMQVCDGLHYAHQKGIVHRDIKPSNIFLLPSGQVKILDFGIAQMANADELTRAGFIMGSLRYISPEQVRGRVDHRSDIYSAGAVFYEFLALRPPFLGEDPLHLLTQLRTEEPPLLDHLDATIPPALAAAVGRALRKDPAERFPDLALMRSQLEAVQRDLVAEAQRSRARGQFEADAGEELDEAHAAPQRQAADETICEGAPDLPTVLAEAPTSAVDSPERIATPTLQAEPAVRTEDLPAVEAVPTPRRRSRRVAVAVLGGLAAVGLGVSLLWLPPVPSPGVRPEPSVKTGDGAPPGSSGKLGESALPQPSGKPGDSAPPAPGPAPVVVDVPPAEKPGTVRPIEPPSPQGDRAPVPPLITPSPRIVSPRQTPPTARREADPRQVVPRTPAPPPPVAGVRGEPSRRCSDILERASLGEPLTDDEQAILTKECR